MKTVHVERNSIPELERLIHTAFPGDRSKKLRVVLEDTVLMSHGWNEGSKDDWMAVTLATPHRAMACASNTDWPTNTRVEVPEGLVFICRSIFMGKNNGLTVVARPDCAFAHQLPAPLDLTWAERVVLYATISYKSTYNNIKDLRFHEAQRETRITANEWVQAKLHLIALGCLNKAGAITALGRNNVRSVGGWPKREVAV